MVITSVSSVIYAITAIIGTLISLGTLGQNVSTIIIGNQAKAKVQEVISKVNSVLDKGGKDADALINALQTKNTHALQTALLSNPLTSRSYNSLVNDSKAISEISSNINSIRSRIASLQSELYSVDYSSSTSAGAAKLKAQQVNDQVDKLGEEMQGEITKLRNMGKNQRESKMTTNALNPISQNIQGGIKNNGL